MKSLIIGKGEVGKALYTILKSQYEVKIRGIELLPEEKKGGKLFFPVLHICLPYFPNFIKEVRKYKIQYHPLFTIIHSTVPIGTSKKCKAFHSPIRGIHPNLIKGIQTFDKYLSPNNITLWNYFQKVGIKIQSVNKTEETEALKLWSTTQYGLNIIIEKEIYKYCKKHNLDFNAVYTKPNQTYNQGYNKLGHPEYNRSILKHINGKIGGHCIIPNCHLLQNKIADIILKYNKYNIKI